MALNVTTFKTRAFTALIFAVVMLAGLLWNQWSFFILFSVIHFGCWIEYQKLIAMADAEYGQISSFHKYGVMIAGWCVMLYFANEGYVLAGVSLHLIGLWLGLFFMFVLPIVEILFVRKIHLKNIGYSALGLLYISLSLGLLTNLRSMFYGSILDIIDKMLVMMIIASLWINDTMAYIVGSFIGRTPISSISPKKTLEGTISGIILAVLIMGWIGYLVSREFDWESILPWMIIAAIASIAGTFGDLLESKLKRLARVKDSGHIMPGHGGFLDRFDSLLVATPFVWLYILFIIKS